ncbi:eukaryotic translation initiation factor 3 subunit M [Aspergillus caelatus]|uniref:Eukaryotic translation initiation factor 3 subunit M n=2 Tax=Aspergillus subgen. Circumdati TaxID=2720871 RepID=A0A5N6ZX48_9EURO|nr:eukaryotic translation initiation factor 3 subunit M [Aspergillus caelatus]KAE8360840.1 eukaryotic translation initiation factor 3 subunit M [Aspergillus caelatus]KAE8417760.1 eukaryotic translation initiation factor 3 subunit M [Aspergillus pseudocaelatus]
MPAPTTTLLIEGSFSELADEFAQYLDALRKSEGTTSIQAEISPLLEPLRQQEQSDAEPDRKQRDEVLKKLVSAASVLNNAPEKEIISAYNLLVHLIHYASDPDMFLSRICSYLAKPITSSAQFGPSLAISILSTIFNTLAPTDSSRFHVFLGIVAVIRQSGSTVAFEALKPQLTAQLPTWLSSWELDEEEAQRLHLAVADAAQAAGDPELAQTHIVQALQTIPAAQASSKEARDLAIRALTSALTHPAVFDFTPLTASDAVQALRSSDSTLFELLEIFTADTLDAYEAFVTATPLAGISGGVLADAGEALQNKMRLLTLASLAASAPSRSLPYATIAAALRVPAEDVEKWVIDTIRAGLVEGKLSQLRSEFLVHRATYRVFGEKQWAEVQGRLMVWRRSLENVLGVLRTERERFVRESLQAAAAAEEAAQGKSNDKGNKSGDRRQRHGNNQPSQQQQQPQEVAAAE